MNIIRWEAPPPVTTGRKPGSRGEVEDRFTAVAEALRSRPGEWAVVFEGPNGAASGVATRIKSAYSPCLAPTGSFEATYRKGRDASVVYARYVGETS